MLLLTYIVFCSCLIRYHRVVTGAFYFYFANIRCYFRRSSVLLMDSITFVHLTVRTFRRFNEVVHYWWTIYRGRWLSWNICGILCICASV